MTSTEEKDIPEVDLGEFVKHIGLEKSVPGRYSLLLAANLYGGALSSTQNPAKIVREIELLEQGELGQLKQPIQNRYPPLKGLWHKHYMQDGLPSLAMNVRKGLDRYRIPVFQQMIDEAEKAGEGRSARTAPHLQMPRPHEA